MKGQLSTTIILILIVLAAIGSTYYVTKEKQTTTTVKTTSTTITTTSIPTESITTITGKYLCIGNPCTTSPCLPGAVYAVLVDGQYYYLTVNGSWLWENLSWDEYTPIEGDNVVVEGYVSKNFDINNNPFYKIEIVSLKSI